MSGIWIVRHYIMMFVVFNRYHHYDGGEFFVYNFFAEKFAYVENK